MSHSFKNKVFRFLKETDGPTTVEYAFFLALIVLACVSTISMLGDRASSAFENTADQLKAETAKST